MLLSFYGMSLTPEDVSKSIPVNLNENGEEIGTINQHLATWCISQGFVVDIYSADFQILDLAWANLSQAELLQRMEAAKGHRNVPALGKEWSECYLQSYIDFVKAGGHLYIQPYMTTALIDKLLESGPTLPAVCYGVLHNVGRSKEAGLRAFSLDDIHGNMVTHSIVVYGKNDAGNYLIADPWEEPGTHEVEPERLLASMTAAQIECDNLIIKLTKK